MQHDQTKIATTKKVDRTRNARLLDKTDISNLDMSLANHKTFVNSPKRKLQTSRMSMMPPPSANMSVINLRKLELENNNLELELNYSAYVASCAELFVEQKILKDTEESLNSSIKKSNEETKSLQGRCKLLETRIKDIKGLSYLNDYVESVQSSINSFKEKQKKYDINEILSQLKKLLDRFNILRCENVILPSTPEELQEFKNTLLDCKAVLEQLSNPIKCDALENVTTDYQDFITMFHEISNVKKIVEEKICNLQSEVLKTCSHALNDE